MCVEGGGCIIPSNVCTELTLIFMTLITNAYINKYEICNAYFTDMIVII